MKLYLLAAFACLHFLPGTACGQELERPWRAQWFVDLEVSTARATKKNPNPHYRLKISRASDKEPRRVLEAGISKELEADLKLISETIVKSFELPKLDKDGNLKPRPQSEIVFVLRRQSRNRHIDIAFGDQDIQGIEMRAAIEKLLAIVNRQLTDARIPEKLLLRQPAKERD